MMLPVWTVGYSRRAVLNRQYVHTQRRILMMLPVWTVGYSQRAVLNRQYVHTQRRSSNDVTSMDSCLLSKSNTQQTIRAHTEKEL